VENTVAKRAMAVKPGLIRIEEVIYIKIQKAFMFSPSGENYVIKR
jgi:hypothetical protein